MKQGLISFFFLFDRVPAFLPQILFDLLAQCFQNQPCQQASAVLPLLGHRGLSVRKDIWQVILKWAIKIRKRMIACSGIKEYLYTFVIEFLTKYIQIWEAYTMQWLRELLSLHCVLFTILRFSTFWISFEILPASIPDIKVAFFAFFPITSSLTCKINVRNKKWFRRTCAYLALIKYAKDLRGFLAKVNINS